MILVADAGRRSAVFAATALAALLTLLFYSCKMHAQELVERDPDKCAFINLANFYLRCAIFQTEMIFEQERLIAKTNSTQNKALLGAILEATKKLQEDYATVAYSAYKFAGREMDIEVMRARRNVYLPDIKAAFEEMEQRSRRDSTRKRNPPKANILDLCSANVLGVEVKDNKKIEERRQEFRREAEQLAQKGRSCIK